MKKRLIISILILLPIVWFISLKVNIYYQVNSLFPYSWNNLDGLEKTPAILKLNSTGKIQTKEIELHDLIIEYPNKEIIKDTIGDNGVMFLFADSSKIIVVYDSHINELDTISSQLSSIDKELVLNYFEENKIKTNYQLLNHVFGLQPSGISWFDSNNSIKIRFALLKLKETILAVGYKDGFKKFKTKTFKGFIFGDTERNKRLIINGFSKSDKRYTIILEGMDFDTTIEILNKIKTNIR